MVQSTLKIPPMTFVFTKQYKFKDIAQVYCKHILSSSIRKSKGNEMSYLSYYHHERSRVAYPPSPALRVFLTALTATYTTYTILNLRLCLAPQESRKSAIYCHISITVNLSAVASSLGNLPNFLVLFHLLTLCGDGVEYLHCSPASSRRR